MEQVWEIALDQIEPNPDQPRTVFGQDALEELARSIKATGGVLEPILVRPENGTGTFRIIAGERRWRASRLVGLDTIRCLVTDVDDERMALLALAENMVREDLTVVEEGRYLRRLMDAGLTWEDVHERLGLSDWHRWKLDLVDGLHERLLWLIEHQHFPANIGWHLTKLSHGGQLRFLRAVQGKRLTPQEQIGLIEALEAEENQTEMFPETKLSEAQRQAVQGFEAVLDRALQAAAKLEKLEERAPGTLTAALSTELDVASEKLRLLINHLRNVRQTVQRERGRLSLSEEVA
jgi:ParB/RepB/Spo0J family partition protein